MSAEKPAVDSDSDIQQRLAAIEQKVAAALARLESQISPGSTKLPQTWANVPSIKTSIRTISARDSATTNLHC